MAYTTAHGKNFYKTKLWTGTGSENAISGIGFQPDFVWIKQRNTTRDNNMFDAVRGATKRIYSNLTNAEETAAQVLKSFDSDGFTLGTDTSANQSSGTYVSWNWKLGTTSVPSGGTITPSAVSYSAAAGMGIYKYTGNGNGSQTIAHGLGKTPTCVIFKELDGTEQWRVHFMKADNPYTYMYLLNSNASESSQNNGLSAVSSTTITFGSDGAYNANGDDYVCYVFADTVGFLKAGKYVGNGSTDGPFVNTGFKPGFVLVKANSTNNWFLQDNERLGYNPANHLQKPNNDGADDTGTHIDILSNGFKVRSSSNNNNQSAYTNLYLAFAEAPLVGSNNVPPTAR